MVMASISIGFGMLITVVLGGRPGSSSFGNFMMSSGLFDDEAQFVFPFCPAVDFLAGTQPGATPAAVSAWIAVPVRSLPTLFSAAIALILARVFLVRRAFLQPGNLLRNFLTALDRWFARINENRVTRGRVLVPDRGGLPEDEPVAWRETTRRSLGKGRYLLRLLLLIELPVAALVGLIAATDASLRIWRLSMLFQATWMTAALVVAVHSANLIGGERSRQTLDVLCTTRLAGREIVLQKYRAVRRLIWMLWVPFLTIIIYAAILVENGPGRAYITIVGTEVPMNPDVPASIGPVLLLIAVYLPSIAWLSMWIGLKLRSGTKAIIAAALVLAAFCLIPILASDLALDEARNSLWIAGRPTWQLKAIMAVRSLSPLSMLQINHFARDELATWHRFLVALNFVGYGACLVFFRWLCRSRADGLLGRLEASARNGRSLADESS